jgi:small subunit ribosomal protein S18
MEEEREQEQYQERYGRAKGRAQRQQQWKARVHQCFFCVEGIDVIDYKKVDGLRRFLSSRGKIKPRRQTGTCARHQRRVARAIKRARQIALLPFTPEHIRGE